MLMSLPSASRTSSPPTLDSPLPSQFEQCELRLEVQPRSYHRAHYETEGSRGSIKAAAGGHPLIKASAQNALKFVFAFRTLAVVLVT